MACVHVHVRRLNMETHTLHHYWGGQSNIPSLLSTGCCVVHDYKFTGLYCVTAVFFFCSGELHFGAVKGKNMDQEVHQFNRWLDKEMQYHHLNDTTEGIASNEKLRHLDHESGSDASDTCVHYCPANDDSHSTKYSSYPNGTARLTDNAAMNVCSLSGDSCEQSPHVASSGPSFVIEQTVDRVPSQLLACNNDTSSNSSEIVDDSKSRNTDELSESKGSSANSEDCTSSSHTADGKAAEIAISTDAVLNGCSKMPHVSSIACQDKVNEGASRKCHSPQLLDSSVPSVVKTSVGMSKKTHETSVPDDKQKTNSKLDSKSDSYRPFGCLVHDLGLELVREQVYRDLIDIQTAKDAKNRLEEREKGQLLKLIEAQERLALRNAPYQLPARRCNRCSFMSPSTNVMTLHHQFGTVSRIDAAMHVCCLCSGRPSFRTRNAAQFMEHLSTVHGLTGRLMKKTAPYACKNCVFEHRNPVRLAVHAEKCVKKFSLATNLQPLPGDCDIPLIYRPSDRKRPGAPPLLQSNTSSDGSFAASGPPSVKTLLSSLKQQVPAGHPGCSYNQLVMPSLICEICGKLVDGREALWGHFRLAHHIELCRTTMSEKEPWMKCDVCNGRFWTYQGLSRHLLLAHNRALATSFTSGTPVTPAVPRCHLCGGSQTSNPLSHFSAYHNVTLLEMYHAKLCCLCNRKVNSGRAFEEHMVQQHSDIFANYDVLRTVLQALTAARYFKADDNREPATQRIMQTSAHGGRNVDISSETLCDVRTKSACGTQTSSATGQSRNYAAADMPDNKRLTAISASAQTTLMKHNPSGVGSSQGGQKKRSNTHTFVTKQKCTVSGNFARKKPVSAPEMQICEFKTNNKGATAEEMKKLYEDLADIGRPVLRSMRRKLSTNAEMKSRQGEDTISVVSEQQDSIDTEEISAKKPHLQSGEQVCDDNINTVI